MTAHACHARKCNTNVPPRMLMCGKHWKMVPGQTQKMIWKHYKSGQEKGEARPSSKWHFYADEAIEAVYKKELKKEESKQTELKF